MPGPNDYHINAKSPESLEPGLGKHELSEGARAALTKNSAAAAAAMRAELEDERAELTERERALDAQAREHAAREQALERRERAVAVAEKAAAKPKPTAEPVDDEATDDGKTDITQL